MSKRHRRFLERLEARRESKRLINEGRKARRERQREPRSMLTREERLTMVYAFRYALKQRVPGLDNVQAAMEPYLHEFKPGTLEHMTADIDAQWALAAYDPSRYSLVRKEQEDFRAMLMREIEGRKQG
ncbi:hypothetical protein QCO44_09335 [Selenomonas sputigena]|uniref:Uncharacterized protein n=1 Tax=Selenomonas sputigena TaxID=69823 RepID=A0ABV3X6K5_9FIRM